MIWHLDFAISLLLKNVDMKLTVQTRIQDLVFFSRGYLLLLEAMGTLDYL